MLTKDDLKEIKKLLSPMEEDVSALKQDVRGLKDSMGKIESNVSLIAKVLDEKDVNLEKRVKRIEDHLSLNDNNQPS